MSSNYSIFSWFSPASTRRRWTRIGTVTTSVVGSVIRHWLGRGTSVMKIWSHPHPSCNLIVDSRVQNGQPIGPGSDSLALHDIRSEFWREDRAQGNYTGSKIYEKMNSAINFILPIMLLFELLHKKRLSGILWEMSNHTASNAMKTFLRISAMSVPSRLESTRRWVQGNQCKPGKRLFWRRQRSSVGYICATR